MFYFQSFGLESIGLSVGWQIVLKDGAQSGHFVYICGPTLGLFFLEPKVKVRSFFTIHRLVSTSLARDRVKIYFHLLTKDRSFRYEQRNVHEI